MSTTRPLLEDISDLHVDVVAALSEATVLIAQIGTAVAEAPVTLAAAQAWLKKYAADNSDTTDNERT